MAESTTWTPEREELLRKLHGTGLTFGQIAQEIGGVTRNAVIGKANRLGLRFKPTTPTGAGGDPRPGRGSDRTAAPGKRGRMVGRLTPAGSSSKAPRLPDAPARPPRAPEYKVLDKYYQGRGRRGGPRRVPPVPETGGAKGILDKYYVGKEKAARARRKRRDSEERALIRLRKAAAERARQEAEREKRAREAETKAGKPAAPKTGPVAKVATLPPAAGPEVKASPDGDPSGSAVQAPADPSKPAKELAGEAQEAPQIREPLRIPLVALTESTCRWPLGDPEAGDFAFCGLPALPRKPYCTDHAKLAYQPMASRRPRERDAGK